MEWPSLTIDDLVCSVPIIQGGMGVGVSMANLAAAVALEGGIGVISAAMPGIGEPDIARNGEQANTRVLQQEIRKARKMTRGILGVNVMVALTNFEGMVKTAVDEGVDILFAGAGLPLNLPSCLQNGARTKLVPIVSSARAAVVICKKWRSRFGRLPDAFVVEGPDAGGHLGFKVEQIDDKAYALEVLVDDVIHAVQSFVEKGRRPIPVIAAGGIFSGGDIKRFLNLGASGVQLGTRFVATHECDADMAFKQAYVDARAEDLMIIQSPVGLPGRVVRNAFVDDVQRGQTKQIKCPYHCLKTCDPQKSPYCIALALANARKGKLKHGFAFAGKNAYRVTEIISVKSLMYSLKKEFAAAGI